MTERISWRRFSIEGAVIVVSILLALGAEAAWENRQERQAEGEALRALQEDFSVNHTRVREVIGTHEWSATMFAQLQAMSPNQVANLPADSVDLYARAIGIPFSFDSRDGTVDGLIASGNLGLITDMELRDALVQWRRLVLDAAEEARNVRLVTELIVGRESQLGGPWRRGQTAEGALTGLALLTQNYPAADLVTATSDAEYMRLARWKQLNGAVYLVQLSRLESQADSVLTLVAANRQ